MNRLGAFGAALLGVLAPSVYAAEITRVASSFEPKDPFGLHLDVGFQRIQQRAGIVREIHAGEEVVDQPELRFQETDTRLNIAAHIGIYQDLEISFLVPIIFQQDRTWSYASGADATNSSIDQNCIAANGSALSPTCATTGTGASPLFGVPSAAYRGGVGNITLGAAYAIFNQAKDDTKPTWVVSLNWELPTAEKLDPTSVTTAFSKAKTGDRTNKITLATAFSRRMGLVEPYFKMAWTLPIRGPGFYSNCDNASPANMAYPGNCGLDQWTRSETGIRMPHVVGVTFGNEFTADEDKQTRQRFALDLRAMANFVSKGRYHNALSDPLGKLLATQEYLQVGGGIGIIARAADFISFRANATLFYNTDHTLTDEEIGRDSPDDADARVSIPVNPGTSAPEVNPNFDYRTDMVSRRFRAVDGFLFGVEVVATFSF